MSSYAVNVADEEGTKGPFNEAEVSDYLIEYRERRPDDTDYRRVTVWEMTEAGSAGKERSVWDFIDAS